MKSLLLLAFVIHSCYCIEVNFRQNFYTGIKKIEIRSCKEEPCVLRVGRVVPVKITFEAAFSKSGEKLGDIEDASLRMYINYYRDRFQYNLGQYSSLCELELIECPIEKRNIYTVEAHLFISTDDSLNKPGGFPERGQKDVYFDVTLNAKKGGEIIGNAMIKMIIE